MQTVTPLRLVQASRKKNYVSIGGRGRFRMVHFTTVFSRDKGKAGEYIKSRRHALRSQRDFGILALSALTTITYP
jgi:hypothetical protein